MAEAGVKAKTQNETWHCKLLPHSPTSLLLVTVSKLLQY